MNTHRRFFCLALLLLLSGCAMLRSWKSIPPPGGCDQCHSRPISNDWQVTYRAATLNDERDRLAFQTPEYTMPSTGKPSSALEVRKVQDVRCFECHKAPSDAHKGRAGSYHHQH